MTKQARRGKVLAEAGHDEDVIFVHIGKPRNWVLYHTMWLTEVGNDTDPKAMEDARAGIPVTTQRRFEVYPDVSKGL